MKTAWIDVSSYMSIIEQAAKNDGKAVIHSRGSDPLEITIDPEYAKKEWAEYELMLAKFERENGLVRKPE
jgi:hypothetical protein